MSTAPEDILKHYWSFDSFRDKQREIIQCTMDGQDTLALLPTGGGKSICFQVPALCMEGICLVVSPLIALMKDQVENLKAKGIQAMALHSGMHFKEIDAALDTCVYGDIKFLYLSPERLRNEIVQVRLQKMNVNLIAVDEAHCISQWGYDFRPAYLLLAEIRKLLPKVPVLALTATATPQVVIDIQEKLHFKKENVIRKSFHRENLSYIMLKEDDIKGRLLKILNRTPGSAIVYVRNRRKTKELAHFLSTQNVSANFYHAGLNFDTRQSRQDDWISDKTRVIVATNAFGMGIDKPDVRTVIHIGFPDSLEAYFQEAGRAGRDGNESYAVALISNVHKSELLKRLNQEFPTREQIKNVYHALGRLFQVAEGSGDEEWYDFDVADFATKLGNKPKEIMTAISFLEKAGHIQLSANADPRSRLKILTSSETIQELTNRNPKSGRLLRSLLRSYGRLFEDHIPINEEVLAKRSGFELEQTITILQKLHSLKLVDYKPSSGLPKLTFIGGRIPKQNVSLSKEVYEKRIVLYKERISAALHFIQTDKICRSQMLLKYFGETDSNHCGKCDVCRGLSKESIAEVDLTKIRNSVQAETSIDELISLFENRSEKQVLKGVQQLLDNNELIYLMNGNVTQP